MSFGADEETWKDLKAWRDECLSLRAELEQAKAKLAELGNEYAIVCHFKHRLEAAEKVVEAARIWRRHDDCLRDPAPSYQCEELDLALDEYDAVTK